MKFTEGYIIALYAIFIQTSGIFIALVFVLASFRMNILRDLLLGHGKAVLDRYHNTTEYYKFLKIIEPKFNENEKDENGNKKKPYSIIIERLRGSIALKEIYGIEEVLIKFTHAEIIDSSKEEPGITGFKRKALPLFLETKSEFNIIKTLTGTAVGVLMLIIILSLYSILFPSCDIIFIISSILIVAGIVLSLILLYWTLIKTVGQEKYKNVTVSNLLKEYPEVNKIY